MTITDVKSTVNGGGIRGPENSDLRRVVSDKLDKKGSSGPWLWLVKSSFIVWMWLQVCRGMLI